MPLNQRVPLPYPSGDNSSDTIIFGTHFNLTTLKHWNYTYYSNNTISNNSRCYLLFEPYTPHLLRNGTFRNGTTCYSPISPMGTRAITGLVFALLFGLSIVFTLINLQKHGRLFLPAETRFRAVGRRWPWYWMLAVGAFGLISGIATIDVDRYYLPELPLVLVNFFWFMMLLATMACIWESVRHWGSWQERQIVDRDPFLLRQDDKRSRTELCLPLVFYFFWWMSFFMFVPQSWTNIEKQRSPEQTRAFAKPTATGIRFKLGAFFLFAAWLTPIYSLHHSIYHYQPRHRGVHNRIMSLIHRTPKRFLLVLPVSLVMIGYSAAFAFDFTISPLNLHPNLGMVYGLGWGTIAFILVVLETAGYIDPNEDREMINQRRIRGQETDAEMGITKKPQWFSKIHVDNKDLNVHDQRAKSVAKLGGGDGTARNIEKSLEPGNMLASQQTEGRHNKNNDAIRKAAGLFFPSSSSTETRIDPFTDSPPVITYVTSGTTSTTGTTNNNTNEDNHSGVTPKDPPQHVRSMLDV